MEPTLIELVSAGDRRALSRLISAIEDGAATHDFPRAPAVIGITGPPGAGKSTLISGLIERYRGLGQTVAVLAVDPSSPITGGAILGDRIRMQGHAGDDGVFIRSMAARGHLGGLNEVASEVLAAMAAGGFDRLIVETVGVGQSEVEVIGVADAVMLVVGPAWGDQIQADKAGIVEIADVFVVNKGDRPGVDEVRRALLEVAETKGRPVIVTTATTGEGIDRLIDEIDRLTGH